MIETYLQYGQWVILFLSIMSLYLVSSVKHEIRLNGYILTGVSRFAGATIFNLYYLPIVFENNLFWLRNDLYPNLIESPLLSKRIIDKRLDLKGIRYIEYDIDQKHLNSLQLNNLPAFKLL